MDDYSKVKEVIVRKSHAESAKEVDVYYITICDRMGSNDCYRICGDCGNQNDRREDKWVG